MISIGSKLHILYNGKTCILHETLFVNKDLNISDLYSSGLYISVFDNFLIYILLIFYNKSKFLIFNLLLILH